MAAGQDASFSRAASSSFKGLPLAHYDSAAGTSPKEGFEMELQSNETTGVGATVSSGVYNLSTSIVGAGIMGLAAKMETMGLILGLLGLVLFGAITQYSLEVLLRCSEAAKVNSYADVMTSAYGRLGRYVSTVLIIVNNFGILVIYLIIIGDVLAGTDASTGLLEGWAGYSSWWTSRYAVLLATCALIAPLVALEHVDSLHHTSFLAIALAGVFIVIIVVVTLVRLMLGTIDFSTINLWPSVGSGRAIFQLFTVVPTIAIAYVCHYNVHPIYMELSPPREAKMKTVMRSSLALCTALYCVTALFGYLLFGSSVQSDLLVNFDSDLGVAGSKVLSDIVRASFVLHLLLVFPVIHFSFRSNLDAVLFPAAVPLTGGTPRFTFLTIGALAASVLMALLLPDAETAFDLTGSLASITLSYTLPGLLAVSSALGVANRGERGVAWAMLIMGLIFSILGLAANIESLLPGSSS